MGVYILDTETTGLSKTDQVIEVGWIEVGSLPTLLTLDSGSNRYLPTVGISSKAEQVHKISYRQLLGSPSTRFVTIPEDVEYMIGHNLEFDVRLLKQSNPSLAQKLNNVKFICTKKLSQVILARFKVNTLNHKLDTLVKVLYPNNWTDIILSEAHDALGDCFKTKKLLEGLLRYIPDVTEWNEVYNKQKIVFPNERREEDE